MTRRPAGFTLLELLLAMAMVSMLMLSLYAGMYTAFRAQRGVTNQTEALRQAKAALDLVEQDLRSILPPGGTFAGPFIGYSGGELAATIDCYTLGSDFGQLAAATSNGMRHVQILLVQDAQTPILAREVVRDILGGDNASPEEEILARNITGFGVSYFDGTTWTDSWDSTQQNNALPLAAELTVEVKAPTTSDPEHKYKLTRIVAFSCGQTPDQAAAIAAAASAGSTGTTVTPAGGTQ
jgi:prepilin-type N-terminal cleavage/methylation domain-containing protein